MTSRDLLVLLATLMLAAAACGPARAEPSFALEVAGAYRVGIAPDGDYLGFGGGRETTTLDDDGMVVTRVSPDGEVRYATALPLDGGAAAWAVALRVGGDGTVWTLSTVYPAIESGGATHSVVHQLDAAGVPVWGRPITDEVGPVEAFDLELGRDGEVLVAAGARLLTLGRDGEVLRARDMSADHGVRATELEPLGDGRLAVLGVPVADDALPPRLLVLGADGEAAWTRDLDGELTGRDSLHADGADGVVVIDVAVGRDLYLITALDAVGAPRWTVVDDVGAATMTATGMAYTRNIAISDNRDAEGKPEDVGVFLIRRDAAGELLSETYLDDIEQLALFDCASSPTGTLLFGGHRDDLGPQLLRFE